MKYLSVIILLIFASNAFGQEIITISKTEAVAKALEHNKTIKIGEKEILESKADFQQTNAVFLPNIVASYTGFTTTNPLMAFGSKLNQEVISQSDFNPLLLNAPSQTTNFATKIEVQQPLINLDGFLKRGAAKSKLNASKMQWERTKDYIALETQKAYMQLQLAYKMVSVLEKAKEAAQENLNVATNSFKQGVLQKADVLAVEMRLTEVENQLQYANSNIKNTSNQLSVLIDDTNFSILQPTDSLNVAVGSTTTANLSENRADIQAMSYATNAYKKLLKAEKMNFLPRLNAFGSYELYDNEIFQADANGYLIGASLSWSLFEGSQRIAKTQKNKASFEKAKIELEQYKMDSQAAIFEAKRMLVDAQNSLKLSLLSLEQSKESLRIRTNRYKEGLEKTTDVLNSETQFAQKQLAYYQTVFNYNYALAYLEFLTKE